MRRCWRNYRPYVRERGQRGAWRGALVAGLLARIYRTGMGLFPKRLAVSPRTAAALAVEGFPARDTIEFGLETEAIAPEPPAPASAPGPARLIYCGRLTPIKNVEQTVRALAGLRRPHEAVSLSCRGGGKRTRAARTAGRGDRVGRRG